MGCSHYILDPDKEIKMVIRCYDCGEIVNPLNPKEGHEKCYSREYCKDGKYYDALMVDIDIDNTIER